MTRWKTKSKLKKVVHMTSVLALWHFHLFLLLDFQFDLDRASDIIVDIAADFLQKFDKIRLVLVDLSKKSRILSLVKDKAAKKGMDPIRFFTFVGDITQLHSKGGLQCNVIANAANW